MEEPIVSVIVPIYNAEKYLCQCLDSIINQTLTDIEIICVDDDSTDGSLDILYEYQKKDKRIIILRQEKINAGAARNKGLAVARGKYLAFLDADDYFRLNMLQECVDGLERENADIVIFRAEQYDERNARITYMPWSCKKEYYPHSKVFSPEEMSLYLFNAFQNWTWNKMFRHSFVSEQVLQFQEVSRTNDMAFVCLSLALAKRILVIEKVFVTYRVGSGTSLQSTNVYAPLSFWEAYTYTKDLLIQYGKYNIYKQSFLNHVLEGIIYNLDSVKKNQRAYDSAKTLIKNNAESEFLFTLFGEKFYFKRHVYKKYMDILANEKNESKRKKCVYKIYQFLNFCKDYGMIYTLIYTKRKFFC